MKQPDILDPPQEPRPPDTEALIAWWNTQIAPKAHCPKLRRINPATLKKWKARLVEIPTLQSEILCAVEEAGPFLKDGGWFSFEFCCGPQRVQKLLNGNYKDNSLAELELISDNVLDLSDIPEHDGPWNAAESKRILAYYRGNWGDNAMNAQRWQTFKSALCGFPAGLVLRVLADHAGLSESRFRPLPGDIRKECHRRQAPFARKGPKVEQEGITWEQYKELNPEKVANLFAGARDLIEAAVRAEPQDEKIIDDVPF